MPIPSHQCHRLQHGSVLEEIKPIVAAVLVPSTFEEETDGDPGEPWMGAEECGKEYEMAVVHPDCDKRG